MDTVVFQRTRALMLLLLVIWLGGCTWPWRDESDGDVHQSFEMLYALSTSHLIQTTDPSGLMKRRTDVDRAVIRLAYRDENRWREDIVGGTSAGRSTGSWIEYNKGDPTVYDASRGVQETTEAEGASPGGDWWMYVDDVAPLGEFDLLEFSSEQEIMCSANTPSIECADTSDGTVALTVRLITNDERIPIYYLELTGQRITQQMSVLRLEPFKR